MFLMCRRLSLVMIVVSVACYDEGTYWGLLRALPWPMPLTNSSSLFPICFADNIDVSKFGVSALEKPPKQEGKLNFSVSLPGFFCFEISSGLNNTTPCITLTNQTLTELMFPRAANGTFVAYSSGSIPARCYDCGSAARTPLTRLLPGCRERVSTSAPRFTTCQSGLNHHWLAPGFFTPHELGFQGWLNLKSLPSAGNVWDPIVMCNVAGACTDLSPLLFLRYWSWSNGTWAINVSTHCHVAPNITAQACVEPPFVWYVCNRMNATDCHTGYLTQCWNGSKVGIVMRVPTWIPVPVRIGPKDFAVALRTRRDFGITAAMVTAITAAVVTSASAITMAVTQVNSIQQLNNVAGQTAQALQHQEQLDHSLKTGLLVVNQRVDVLQEELDLLVSVMRAPCLIQSLAVSVSPFPVEQYSELADKSHKLGLMINTSWNNNFTTLLQEL